MSDAVENKVTQRLLGSGESTRVAFVSRANDPMAVGPHICALLNGNGGTVLGGVDESGRVVPGPASEAAADVLRRFLHEHIAPRSLFTVSVDDVASGPVIAIDVPGGRDKPYAFDGVVYCRNGTTTARATAVAMQRMVEDRTAESERWERRAAPGLEVVDLDAKLIRQTVRRAEDARSYQFADRTDQRAVLNDLSLLRHGQLTHAADVLFGMRVAVREPQTRVRAVRYATDKGDRFIDEQLFEGPAFQLLGSSMAFLKRHLSVSAEFREGQLSRESRPQYPFDALREGLVNALVHRDYASFSGSVSLGVFPERVEIWNSGRLPEGMSIKDLERQTHPSVLVNPDISHVFYLHELMERVGRGTFKIVQECKQWGLKPPRWEAGPGVRLTFYGATAQADFRGRFNNRQESLLETLAVGDTVRTPEYVARFATDVTERQARRDLVELESAGYLRRAGTGMTTVFERTDKNLKQRSPKGPSDMSGHG